MTVLLHGTGCNRIHSVELLCGSRGDRKNVLGLPRDEKIFYGIPVGIQMYLTFMVHLDQQVNSLSTSFICKTLGVFFITMITRIKIPASVNIENFY